jgi:Sugar (pentulose and hexulose) kinases
MALKSYLIFDFGASNGRAAVANFDGSKFDIDVVHRFDNTPVYANGILYWDFLRLFSELKSGIIAASKKYKDIVSLGVDTWGVDFGLLDKNGRLIANLEHYRDEKRLTVENDLYKVLPKRQLFELSGGQLIPIASLFHLYELKKRKALQYEKASHFLMFPDLFNYFLTGNKFNEYTEASTSLMVNQVEKKWSREIFKVMGFPEDIFCKIIQPGSVVGSLQKSIMDELSVKSMPVIAPATHDTASAIAGFPIKDKSRNSLLLSMGTWGILAQETLSPVINDAMFSTGFANEAGVEGTNYIVNNITGLWITQQCMIKWRKEKGEDFSWKNIDAMYLAAKPFQAFIDVDDPVFTPASLDMNKTISEYCIRTGQALPEGAGGISRMLYENLVFKVRLKLEQLESVNKKKIEYIHIVGGGSRNRLLCQWFSDATGLPVDSGPAETTSIGNLLMQLKASKEIKNLEEGRVVSFNSSEVDHFEPAGSEKNSWDRQYEKYIKFINLKN